MSDLRQREHYRHFTPITTRWHDNDVYGHVNNVVYYSFFDSAVNRLLVREGGLDIDQGEGDRAGGQLRLRLPGAGGLPA